MAKTPPPTKPLKLELEQTASAAVLHIVGSAGMDQAHRLQQKLEELAAKPSPLIVVDMAGMDFISSMGLGALIAGHLRARRNHGEIRLAAARPAVLQLLETTRLTKLFTVYGSAQEALAAPRTET